MKAQKHALVFGASGISGNALCNELLEYPNKNTFDKVTGLTNRPLSIKDAQLPEDPRLRLISGIDLTRDVDTVKRELETKVDDIHEVTHLFFMAYIEKQSYEELVPVNVALLRTAVTAVDALAPNLEHVVLQTGGKAYGVEFPDVVTLKPPFKESLPRIPEPHASKIFYYGQVDELANLAKSRKWTWTEVRPDVIVGFVPNTNAMNAAGPLAYYLSLYRHLHGKNAEVPFPSTEKAWNATHTDTSAYILSHFEIYAALHPENTAARSFNIADGDVTTWAEVWGGIVGYFGLKPGQPDPSWGSIKDFFDKHTKEWEEVVHKNRLVKREENATTWAFAQAILNRDFDCEYDLTAAREAGFTGTVPTVRSYCRVFDKMSGAKFIP